MNQTTIDNIMDSQPEIKQLWISIQLYYNLQASVISQAQVFSVILANLKYVH